MANYGYKGWIRLWRSQMQTDLYTEEPFDKWHAFIDLCLMADSQGTVKTSLEALKNRWFWQSTHKVRDYLGTVEGSGLGTVYSTPRKGTLIRINPEFLGIAKPKKKGKSGTASGTVSGTEELLPKEVVGGSSLGTTPPNNIFNKNINSKSMKELLEELDDEYE